MNDMIACDRCGREVEPATTAARATLCSECILRTLFEA